MRRTLLAVTAVFAFLMAISQAATLGVKDLKVSAKGVSETLTYPKKLSKRLSADATGALKAQFTVIDTDTNAPKQVHQVFLLLKHETHGNEFVHVCDGTGGEFTCSVDLRKTSTLESLDGRPGNYKLVLLLGHFGDYKSTSYELGTVALSFNEFVVDKGSKSKTVPKIPFEKLPEIEHVFRAPEKMPPAFVSTVFAGLVLAPWILLLGLWSYLGVNISNFSFSPSALFFNTGFLASIASILVLYYYYWTSINLFQCLAYLTPLGGVTMFFGKQALSLRASKREKGQL